MSSGLGITTLLGCLDSGEKLADLQPEDWKEGGKLSSEQDTFLELQAGWRKGLEFFDTKSLRSFATNVHDDVLKKMLEWKMRLDPLPKGGPGAVYMISQLKEMMKWKKVGKKVTHREWPEFILEEDVSFYLWPYFNDLVVKVEVEGGDTVYLLRLNDPLSGFELYTMIKAVEDQMVLVEQVEYRGVQIPCVMADLEPDTEWLLGIINKGWFISYIQQKILFGMNEEGFAVREETAMAMEKCIRFEPKPYIISPNGESFLFWRRRPGVSFPISMFQFTKEDFKNPGDLNAIVE